MTEADQILKEAKRRAWDAFSDVARAIGGTGENTCNVTVEALRGDATDTVDMFVGDVVNEILKSAEFVKRIVIEPLA